MPCRDDYPSNTVDLEHKRAAKLLVYISDATGRPLSSVSFRRQAKDAYGYNAVVNRGQATIDLCSVMKSLTADEFNKHVYDGRIPEARDLAAWWDSHTAADRAREEREAADYRRQKLVISARNKLTDDEWDAILESELE